MGILYVVATPIGNLEDITIRAIKTLLGTNTIACEDTRRTGQLMNILKDKYRSFFEFNDVKKKYISIRDWNELKTIPKIVEELSISDVALVSDAGTPLISDPGYKLVREVRSMGIQVVPIPGPSAVISAISVSGLPTNKFMFWGFLPKYYELTSGMTHVIYESPRRVKRTISNISKKYPEAEIVIAQEMTKFHEYIGSDFNVVEKGEVTLIVYLPE